MITERLIRAINTRINNGDTEIRNPGDIIATAYSQVYQYFSSIQQRTNFNPNQIIQFHQQIDQLNIQLNFPLMPAEVFFAMLRNGIAIRLIDVNK